VYTKTSQDVSYTIIKTKTYHAMELVEKMDSNMVLHILARLMASFQLAMCPHQGMKVSIRP
jgi:hypothetical protein